MWPLINWKSVECSWFLGQEVTSSLFKAEKQGQSIATLGWSLAESHGSFSYGSDLCGLVRDDKQSKKKNSFKLSQGPYLKK